MYFRPHKISDILTTIRDNVGLFPSFLSLLRKETGSFWEAEFSLENLEFMGESGTTLIFQVKQELKGGPELKLLFPNPLQAKNRLGIFLLDLNFEHENPFYDHITVKILHYPEILEFCQKIPQLPNEIKQLLYKIGDEGYRAEIWKLQQKEDGDTLKNWMEQENPKFLQDSQICRGIFESFQNFFECSNIHRNLSPSQIFFSKGDKYKFPLHVREYSILALSTDRQQNYYKDPVLISKEILRPNYKSNIYTVGKLLEEIMTRINHEDNCITSADFFGLTPLIEMMVEPDPEYRMDLEKFQSIWWNEDKEIFEMKSNDDLPRAERVLLFRLVDVTVHEKVVPLVVPEAVKLFKDSFKGEEFVEMLLSKTEGRDTMEY